MLVLSSIGSAMEGICGVPPVCTKQYDCLQGGKNLNLGICTACHAEVKNVIPPGPSALQQAYDRDTKIDISGVKIATRHGECDWCGKAYNISGGSMWQTPWGILVPHCSDKCAKSHAAFNVVHDWQLHLIREHRYSPKQH